MQRRNEKKRKGIVEAAAKLFASRPFHEVKLDEVAAAAKVGKGTLYIYFKNKDDLYFSLVYDGFAQMVTQLVAMREEKCSAMTRLRRIVGELVGFAYHHPHFFEMMRTMGPQKDRKAQWSGKRTEMTRLIEGTIREGIAEGTLRDERPELTALCVPGLVRSVMLFGPGGMERDVVEEYVFGLVIRGIGKK